MGLLSWLKGIFGLVDSPPHIYEESGLLFPQLDVVRLQRRMGLVQEGKTRGAQNAPPTDQDAFDDLENRIVTFIQSEAGKAYDKVASYLRAYNDRLVALQLGTHLAELITTADAARTDFIAGVYKGRDLLFQLRNDVIGIKKDFERFREQNKVDRLPRYPLSLRWYWGVLLILVLVEAFLNGNLLARGLVLGVLGGVTYALIIAVINVGLGVLAGRIAVPNLIHLRRWRQVLAIVGLAAWFCIALLFNLTVAHYRSALGGENPSDAEKIAIQQLLANPIAIREVSGWLLFILGISFSCIAAVDGWKMDDPYPGYGAIARRREEKNQDYVQQKEQLMSHFKEIRDGAKSTMKERAGEVEVRAQQYKSVQHSRLRCVELFQNHLAHLEQCGNELLSTYRQANRTQRTSAPPAHFSNSWQLPRTADLGIHIPSDDSFLQKQLKDTLEELGTAQRRIDEAFQLALDEFKSLEELSDEVVHGN